MSITAPTLGAAVVYRTPTLVDEAAIVTRVYGDGAVDLHVILPFAQGAEDKQHVVQADSLTPQGGQFTYATLTTSQQITRDFALSEGRAHGVPIGRPAAYGAYIGLGNDLGPSSWDVGYLEAWGVLYNEQSVVTPPANTLVNLTRLELWWVDSSGVWTLGSTTKAPVDNNYYTEDFSGANGGLLGPTTIRVESDGTTSFTTPVGKVAHLNDPAPRIAINPATFAGVVCYGTAQLVLVNPGSTDDRASAKLLLAIGVDPYYAATGGGTANNTSVASGCMKYVSTQPRSFCCTTLLLSELTANPPPINLSGLNP
jgi:hypothetical protein